jgi:hypothetical protein
MEVDQNFKKKISFWKNRFSNYIIKQLFIKDRFGFDKPSNELCTSATHAFFPVPIEFIEVESINDCFYYAVCLFLEIGTNADKYHVMFLIILHVSNFSKVDDYFHKIFRDSKLIKYDQFLDSPFPDQNDESLLISADSQSFNFQNELIEDFSIVRKII